MRPFKPHIYTNTQPEHPVAFKPTISLHQGVEQEFSVNKAIENQGVTDSNSASQQENVLSQTYPSDQLEVLETAIRALLNTGPESQNKKTVIEEATKE